MSSKKTSIGGQALINGIMMKGPSKTSMAVRMKDGSIDVETWENNGAKWYNKCPIIRGVMNFGQSIISGYSCIMKSAEKSGFFDDEEAEEQQDMPGWMLALVALGSLFLSLFLFIVLPGTATDFINKYYPMGGFKYLAEGVIKILVFLVYLTLVARMSDIKTMFQYHGAEHKTIACYEAGEELTPENCMKHTRLHPRCGTSFLLIAIVVSIVVNGFVGIEDVLLKMVVRIILLPLIVGISYEIIKFAGRHDNCFCRGFSKPGMWFQLITTNEPTTEQLEIAIASVKPVLPEVGENDKW